MRSFPFRAIAALSLLTGLVEPAAAASFQITGVAPVAAVRGTSPPPLMAVFSVVQPGATEDWNASLEGNPGWASLSRSSGSGAGSLTITLAVNNLVPGTFSSALLLNSGGTVSRQAFTVSLILPNVVKMEADLTRPIIYALHRSPQSTSQPGYLIFLNTDSEKVEKVIPVGLNPTDFDISYPEGVIYVTNHGAASGSIRVINPVTATEVRTVAGGNDVYKINAGKSGRIVAEGLDQWISASLLNSATGATLASGLQREGDAEFDPSGRYYYRSDNNISNAHLTRYDMAADTFASPVEGVQRPYGTRNLVMCGDGSRLFWNSYLYDRDLNEQRSFGTEIYSCTFRGEIAFGASSAFNVTTGATLATLPVTSTVSAVSGDQLKLFQFNSGTGGFTRTLMSAIGPVPPPVAVPQPANDSFIFTPLSRLQWSSAAGALKYRVYFGTEAAAVAAAVAASPHYLGETEALFKTPPAALRPGTTYYWRIDPVGFTGVTPGTVWQFTTSALEISPNSLGVKLPRGSLPQSLPIITSAAAAGPWTAAESLPWLSLSAAGGTSGDTLIATFNPTGLAAGLYSGEISLGFGGTTARLPVSFELFDLVLTKMIPDPSRPWIYGLHSGTSTNPASYIVLINTGTRQITSAIPVGIGATDLTINHQEGKLYVSNWQGTSIQVINLETQALLPPLPSGRDVYKLNAGRAGRLYAEEQDQWIDLTIIDSKTGNVLPSAVGFYREGDGEVDPTGRYYYHCENNSSGAALRKLDISADTWTLLKSGPVTGYGTRNLVMSPDGSRLFWQTQVYDPELNVLRNLGAEVYATTQRGELAFTSQQVLNTANGSVMTTLPAASTVSAVSGDQSVFCYFNATLKTIGFVSMATIAPVPPPGANGQPPHDSVQLSPVARLSWDVVAAALKYRVYFGTDAGMVASATPASAQYLGETPNAFWELSPASIAPGGQYFWRFDPVGLTATTTGSVLSFRTLPVTVSPLAVEQRSLTGAPPQSVKLAVSGGGAGTAWTATTTGAPWLNVVTPSGMTGDDLELMLTPGSLAAGSFTGSVTLSAGGLSTVIPVKFSVEVPAYTALMADPARPRIYALQRPASKVGSLVIINSTTSAIERVLPLSTNPTGFDLTPDGQFIYVVTMGGRKMHRFNLLDWTTSERALAVSTDHQDASRYRVAAGTGTKVYWTDGEWAPRLHSLDFATGLETGPAILADGSNGFGQIARNAAGTGLAAWTQYGWSAGSSGSMALNVDTRGVSATVGSGGVNMERDPLNAPVLVRADGSATFIKKYKLGPDLTSIEAEYPSEIYAATPDRGIVFGATQAWRERTMTPVWQAPAGVNAQISAVTGDSSAFYYFNTVSSTLVRVAMSSLGDVPGPQPEDGEVVEAMPTTLAWTPKSGALRYEVYFGTDPAAVLAASGPASPLYLGSATTASLPVDLPFRIAGIWWWRVDTVLAGSTTKGSVWKFSGALSYLGLIKGAYGGYSSLPPALAMEGTTILSGYGSYSTEFSTPAGQVLVHTKRIGMEEWEMTQRIDKPASASAAAGFGTAIAMKGDTAWISAPADGIGGRVHEFRQDSATRRWQATGRTLQSPAPAAGDSFGTSLAFDGSVIAVGLPGAIAGSNYQSGAVEIFDAVTLARHVRIAEATGVSYARFGSILSLGSGILAISNPARTVSGVPAGAVDVWTRGSGTTWTRTTTITCPTPASNRGFGSALVLSGDRLYAGTSSELSAGKVFSFQKGSGSTWNLLTQIPRSGPVRTDSYANSLALDGDLLAIGAPSKFSSSSAVKEDVWLHRHSGPSGWNAVAPALPGLNKSLQRYGVALALTKRYLVTGYQNDSNSNGGFTVHLHNPAGNLPPYATSSPVIFAEVGRPYQYTLTGADENAGDILTLTGASVLPAWLSFTPSSNGRALLSGTPPPGSAGDIAIRLRLEDAAGDAAEQNFILRVQPTGGIPQILSVTGDRTSDDGKPWSLGVTVEPGAPVTYQWYWNGVPLNGQTGPSLSIGNVQSSDAGSYSVRVTRSGIWVDSAPVILTINQVADRFGGDWPTFGATTSHAGTYPATLGQHKLLPAWTIPQTGSNPVVTGGGRIYSVQGGGFAEGGSVSAYAAATGVRLWTSPLPSSFSVNPPTYHRGKVYMQRGKGTGDTPDLRCYDAATGVLQWKSTFGAQWENYFAPTVDDTGIYINGGDYGGLYRFGLDGTQSYFQGLAQFDNWTPLLHQGKLYSWVSGTFTHHELQSGSSLYSLTVPWDWRGYDMNTVPAAEGNLAAMLSTTEVFVVDLAARRVLWKKAGSFRGTPALKNGIAYVIGTTGVQTFDALTGTAGRLYPTRTANNAEVMAMHQPVLLDDTLLVSSDSLLWTLDLASGSLLQRLTGGGALTYSDGILLASGTDSTLRAWKVNQPTRLTAPLPAMAAVEDVPFQWDLQVADPDGDAPALSMTGLPAWLTAAPLQLGVVRFSGTPLNAHAGPIAIQVTANDLKSFPSTLLITGSVIPVNDRPVATSLTLTRLEDAPAEAISLAGIFSDEETAVTALKYSIVSNPAGGVLAALDGAAGTSLRLTYQADVSGQAIITVRATDPEGLFADSVITVNVAPVNDAPVFHRDPPPLSGGPAALNQLVDFSPFVRDADSGDVLIWRIVSNTNPGLFTRLEFDAGGVLTIHYAPYAAGQAAITAEVRDQAGATAQQSFIIELPAPPPPAISTTATMAVNRQTGLWEQRVTVRNAGERAIGGFEISVTGLPAGASLYNASDVRPPAFIAGYYQPLGAGEAVTLMLEYYSVSRGSLNPVLSTAVLLPRAAVAPATGETVAIDRMLMLEPGAFLLEFTAVPGQLYQVQYSNGGAWADAMVRIRAAGNRVQWIDRGAPRTTSPPLPGTSRFYRVKHLPAP